MGGVMAHHKAVGAVSESKAVLSQADFEAVNAALGRMIASAPESQVMDVYNAFSTLTSPDVPAFLMSTVNEANAKAAYAAFLKFKDVVKANPITPAAVSTPAALNGNSGPSTPPLASFPRPLIPSSRTSTGLRISA